ncbi:MULTISPECIES: cytochrome P450 [unclassified Crossiella]|uniref:cytochrome P450 n=1 Tax=unclassified Crossiella TaxID=2620835 RepID=UPI001FFEE80D|nr:MULTISPECIES: cytochrome P450 [unclassified Crossiella]MCK2243763.1 cytochrome P450 [Crossiella sp. S99.2]MCK2257622.1 cytochrome P450 [Crossiella sp. S99.1]
MGGEAGTGQDRRLIRDGASDCPVTQVAAGHWSVRGLAAGRTVLRSTETRQAGLAIERMDKLPSSLRRPVLYRDGPEHREHRRQTARFFTPRRVEEHYRPLMRRVVEQQIALLHKEKSVDLGRLSFELALTVVAEVVGLTDSKPGMAGRLEAFFPVRPPGFLALNLAWLRFHFGDVRPAVRARRRARRDDLISHLIDEGCRDSEILGECLTFAAAGMVTTREFINLAAWHLFADPDLCERYRTAEEPDRLAILHELLRLEPVVNTLKRRTIAPIELAGEAGPVTIPAGDLVEIEISATNVDPAAVGDRPADICPGRELVGGPGPVALAFGDGAHRCPGAYIAMLESDLFLHALFAQPGITLESAPTVAFRPEIAAYELRGLRVSVRGT